MLKETEREDVLPKGQRWDDLAGRSGVEQLDFYKRLLLNLSALGSPRVRDIYTDAATTLRQPKTLTELVKHIDGLQWYSETREHMGDLWWNPYPKGHPYSGSNQGDVYLRLLGVAPNLVTPVRGVIPWAASLE
ncbi:hypothetical protein [Archangium sp.]|uniref:hypothetical protein n=1 Tax=Archangium sp. TaxID=1872627 RepID=UPI002D249DC2|nr:hypothetical protein [Archangium sp.]HYO55987.1 hypothetical protein [Archangium sp.]